MVGCSIPKLPRKNGIHRVSEDSSEVSPQIKVAISLRRDDRRIAADLDWRLKAPMDHKVIGNSAFFSEERLSVFVVWALGRTRCCVARADAHATGYGAPFSTYKN